jgi:hypothetical protein
LIVTRVYNGVLIDKGHAVKHLPQVLFLLLLFSGPAMPAGRLAEVEIQYRSGAETLPVYESSGHWFVPGRPGHEYQVNIRNCGTDDLLAVVSVDGINVVTGETAAAGQSGYVIQAGTALSIAGWRKRLQKTAAFYFTDFGDSYASRTGRPDNVGVIGVALFRRRAQPLVHLQPPEARAEAGASNDNAARPARAPEKKIGTGHGRSQDAPARYVEFERASDVPAEIIAIHYDTHANLVARGIIREDGKLPLPFPGKFVADPPPRG